MPTPPARLPVRSRGPRWRGVLAALLCATGVAEGAPLQNGDVLVTDSSANKLYLIPQGTGPLTELTAGNLMLVPIGVAVHSDGRAFVTVTGGLGGVVRVDPDATPPTLLQFMIRTFIPIRPRGIAIGPLSDDADINLPGNTLDVPDSVIRIDTVTGAGPTVTAADKLLFPAGIVREASGALVVADSGVLNFQNISKVVRVDPETGAQTLLARGGLFVVLRDIEVNPDPPGGFLVVDSGARKLIRVDDSIPFDPDHPNANQSDWAACPQFVSPRGIAVEANHDVLVADFSAKKLFRIAHGQTLPRQCTEVPTGGVLVGPWDVTVVKDVVPFVPTQLLIADAGRNQIYRVDPAAGAAAPPPKWGTGLTFSAPVAAIHGLAEDSYFVLEKDSIQRVVAGVKTLVAIITSDPVTEEPVDLTSIAIDAEGELLVTDAANDRLLRVKPDTGEQIVMADDDFDPPAALAAPAGVALALNGTIAIANRGHPLETPPIPSSIVDVHPLSGVVTPVIAADPGEETAGIAVDRNGDLLFNDPANDRVWRARISTPPDPALYAFSSGNQIESLRGIAVDQNRSVLVSNQGTAAILRIEPASGVQIPVGPSGFFADIRGISLDRIPSPPILDFDLDTVSDPVDNCSEGANPDQTDTDQDGFGNRCDADYDDNGAVNVLDLGLFKDAYLTQAGNPSYDPEIDMDSDGVIGVLDLGIFRSLFLRPPGPSGLTCAGSIPCPLLP